MLHKDYDRKGSEEKISDCEPQGDWAKANRLAVNRKS
jgi:hypothetical protein